MLIETSRGFGRGILRGIIQYAKLYGPWQLYHWPGDFEQMLPNMRDWGGNGIIARIPNSRIERAILETNLPVVGITLNEEQRDPKHPCARFSEVRADSIRAGERAAEFLLEKQLNHFAFVGEINNENWSRQRCEGFSQHLKAAGKNSMIYPQPPKLKRDWGQEVFLLGKWLATLPKPVGLLAAMDARGRQVIAACNEFGIRVPGEIAVLGIDNDELICETCQPPMSSVMLDTPQGGFFAAEMLDQMMQGKQSRPQCCLVPALHVIPRHSTDISLISDETVAEAVRFIIANSLTSSNVASVTNHMDLSRKNLEKRFKKAMGCSVLTVINQERIKRIKVLLTETNLSIQEIAEKCHFDCASNLCKFFRRECKTTMNKYRQQWKMSLSE